ncbi:MAG: potassium transporter TrkA [Actinomycetota bacterium]
MGHGVQMQELPGIGRRYDIDLGRPDNRVSVIVRRDGTRDLYVFASTSSEPTAVLELSEERARKLSAVLSETFFEG